MDAMNAYLIYALALALQIMAPAPQRLAVDLVQDNAPHGEYVLQREGSLFHVTVRDAQAGGASTTTGGSSSPEPYADIEQSSYFSDVFTAIPRLRVTTPQQTVAPGTQSMSSTPGRSTGTSSSVSAANTQSKPSTPGFFDQPVAFTLKAALQLLRSTGAHPSQQLSVPDPFAIPAAATGSGGAAATGATQAGASGVTAASQPAGAGNAASPSSMTVTIDVRNGLTYVGLPDHGLLLVFSRPALP